MKNFFLFLIVGLILIYGCKKEDKPYVPVQRCPDLTNNIDTINKYIHGTWEWLEEKRYDRYQNGYIFLTPKTPESYNITMKLNGDTVRFFRNSAPDSVYNFKIQRELEITNYPTDSLTVIAYYSFYTGGLRNYVPIKICKDQLLMQNQFVSSIVGESIWERK